MGLEAHETAELAPLPCRKHMVANTLRRAVQGQSKVNISKRLAAPPRQETDRDFGTAPEGMMIQREEGI